jgi:phenylacetate-CoA ligase
MAHALESLYPHVPVWAQNLGISLFGLAYRHERLGGDFERHVAGFRERDRWSREQMHEYVERELRRVLLRAFDQVPYYQRHWKVSRQDLGRIRLADLPITPKKDLRAASDDFVARDCRGRVHNYLSSGSTGTPVSVACTAEDHRRYIAAREVRSFGWAGASVRWPRSMIGGRRVVPDGLSHAPFHRYNWAERQVYFSAFHIAPAHVPDYVAAFNKYRPRLLTGYAYSHFLLSRMMNEQKLTLDYEPAAAVLSSEKLTPVMKQEIRQALRTRAFEEYGAVENCLLATECEKGRLHVSPDFGVLEIVDAAGQPVPPGVEGSVVCTSLVSEAQPLIRYEVGDRAIWAKDGCACGRDHLPVLEEVVGRLEDVVVGTDGREMVRFHWVFIDLPNVLEGQIVQEALDRLTLKLVTRPGFGATEEREIRRRFAERLGPVQLQIEPVPEIPRTERGKFRAVISKLERPWSA